MSEGIFLWLCIRKGKTWRLSKVHCAYTHTASCCFLFVLPSLFFSLTSGCLPGSLLALMCQEAVPGYLSMFFCLCPCVLFSSLSRLPQRSMIESSDSSPWRTCCAGSPEKTTTSSNTSSATWTSESYYCASSKLRALRYARHAHPNTFFSL